MFGFPIFFSRFLSPLPIDVRLSETHELGTTVTSVPIENGATINDHAYVKSAKLKIEFASANPTLAWQQLKRVNASRAPFTIVTGLDVYRNMLIDMGSVTLDKDQNRILRGTVDLLEVKIADTAYGFAIPDGTASASSASSGAAGGANSTRAAAPSPSCATDAATADAAYGTVARGDSPTANPHPDAPAQNTSILASIF